MEDKNEPKGKEKKGFTPRKKKEEITHEKGKYVPIIGVTNITVPGRYNEFTLQTTGLLEVAEVVGQHLYDVSDRFRSGAYQPEVILDATRRMALMLFAKKLAYAADPENAIRYSGQFAEFRRMNLFACKPLKKVVEGYGFFTLNQASYRPEDVAFVAFSSFAHGVGTRGQNGLPLDLNERDYIVDAQYPDWKLKTFQKYRRHYNRFARNSDVLIDLQQMRIAPPITETGFNHLQALLGNAVPAEIRQTIQIASAFEDNLNNNNFPTDAQVLALRALGVVVVNWDRQRIRDLASLYVVQFENLVAGLMKHVFEYEQQVKEFLPEGAPWQLMDSTNDTGTVSSHPFGLSGSEVEMGIIAHNETEYAIDVRQVESASTVSGHAARDRFVRSCIVGGQVI